MQTDKRERELIERKNQIETRKSLNNFNIDNSSSSSSISSHSNNNGGKHNEKLDDVKELTSERGFSCLKRLKTYLRSTMVQERLSSLAILNFESKMINLIDVEAIVNEFGSKNNRKFSFF